MDKLDHASLRIFDMLTHREREVILLLLEGITNIEIANRLEISHHTVRRHMNHIFQKTGLDNRVQVALMLEQRAPLKQAVLDAVARVKQAHPSEQIHIVRSAGRLYDMG